MCVGILRISHILRKGCWRFAYFMYLMRGDDYGCGIVVCFNTVTRELPMAAGHCLYWFL